MLEQVKTDFLRSNRSKTVCIIMLIYRFGNKVYYSERNPVFKKITLYLLNIIYKFFVYLPYHIEIPFCSNIGAGLRLIHYQGIVISGSTVIGENCTIFHQVTIGVNEDDEDKKAALIGNNVYIGCGAKIIGNITIGNNVKIGANSIVTKNIPSDCIVVGVNRIIKY